MKKYLALIFLTNFIFSCGGADSTQSNQYPQPPQNNPPSNITSYIIPLYSYPIGQYQSQWQALYNLQTSKHVLVIIDPNSGHGAQADPNFTNAIATLKSKDFKVLGYVHTSYGQRDIQSVEDDINNWFSLYGDANIDGIFLDEASTNDQYFSYYQTLYNYIKSFGNKLVVLNPGTNIELKFFNIADKIVVFEDSESNYETFAYNNYSSENSDNVCTIVYSAPQDKVSFVETKSLQNNSSCDYITNGDNNTGYFYLSSYLK